MGSPFCPSVIERMLKGEDDVNSYNVAIIEEPQQRGYRFRYECEGHSHGGLQGSGSERGSKTYPTISIRGLDAPKSIVTVSLWTMDEPPRPHVHDLIGKNCRDGKYSVEVKRDSYDKVIFNSLSIRNTKKSDVVRILKDRKALEIMTMQSPWTDEQLTQAAESEAKEMQLNVVRLKFEVMPVGSLSPNVAHAFSHPVYDSKCPAASLLKICRISCSSGSCRGGTEVFLLCEKVQKDIQIRFRDRTSSREGKVWEALATFSALDIHRQYAVVFRTPAYWNQHLAEDVEVDLQLVRPNDGQESPSVPFRYCADRSEQEQIIRKRKRLAFDSTSDVRFFLDSLAISIPSSGHQELPIVGSGTGVASGFGVETAVDIRSSDNSDYAIAVSLPAISTLSMSYQDYSSTGQPATVTNFGGGIPSGMSFDQSAAAAEAEAMLQPSEYPPMSVPAGDMLTPTFEIPVTDFQLTQDLSDDIVEMDCAPDVDAWPLPAPFSKLPEPLSVKSLPTLQPGHSKVTAGAAPADRQSSRSVLGLLDATRDDDEDADAAPYKKAPSPNARRAAAAPVATSAFASSKQSLPQLRVAGESESSKGCTGSSGCAPCGAVLPPPRVEQQPTSGATKPSALVPSLKQACEKTATGGASSSVALAQMQAACVERLTTELTHGLHDFAASGDSRFLLAVIRGLYCEADSNGDNPLHVAVINERRDSLECLLSAGGSCTVVALQQPNLLGQTPLHVAAALRMASTVKVLLSYGADSAIQDVSGNSIWHIAARDADLATLRVLGAAVSADVARCCTNVRNYEGLTPLHLAVRAGAADCVKELIACGADPNVADGKTGRSALHHAVERGDLDVASYLIFAAHADVDQPTYDGNTPLHLAAAAGDVSVVATLIACGASTKLENNEPKECKSCDSCDHDEFVHGHRPRDLALSKQIVDLIDGKQTVVNELLPLPTVSHRSGSRPGVSRSSAVGSMACIDDGSRRALAGMLDRSPELWARLAALVGLNELVPVLKDAASPTQALLANYEAMDGSAADLCRCFVQMNLGEAAKLVERRCSAAAAADASATVDGNGDTAKRSSGTSFDSGVCTSFANGERPRSSLDSC